MNSRSRSFRSVILSAVPAKNQSVPAEPHTITGAAHEHVVAITPLEPVVAVPAVEPSGQGDAAGHLEVVVARLAVGDNPSRWMEGPQRSAVEVDIDIAGVAHWAEDD